MKWLIQEFLNQPGNTERMIKALENLQISYGVVRLNKDRTLTLLDINTRIPVGNTEKELEHFIQGHRVMIYGSKTFSEIAIERRWSPGSYWNSSFEFDVFQKKLGDELLNPFFLTGELNELVPTEEEFFIRPTGNTKLFTGMVVSLKAFNEWKEREKVIDSPYRGEPLLIAPIQQIEAEYRLFIVNQQVVTASSYLVNGITDQTAEIESELLDYAEGVLQRFHLADAYVLDIAKTVNGYKTIEYNNINTSGLYGCDEAKIIKAIEELEKES